MVLPGGIGEEPYPTPRFVNNSHSASSSGDSSSLADSDCQSSYPEWARGNDRKYKTARICIDEVNGVALTDEDECLNCKHAGVSCFKTKNRVNCAYCISKKFGAPKLCSLNPSSIANPHLSSASMATSTLNGNSQKMKERPLSRPRKYRAGKSSILTAKTSKPNKQLSYKAVTKNSAANAANRSKRLTTALESFLDHFVSEALEEKLEDKLEEKLDKELEEKLEECLENKFKESEVLKDRIAEAKAAIKVDLKAKLSTEPKSELRTKMRTEARAEQDIGPNQQSTDIKELEKNFAELKDAHNILLIRQQAHNSQFKAIADKIDLLEAERQKPWGSHRLI